MSREVTVLVMTDGRRDCIERTVESADLNLRGNIARVVVHDDSGDDDYAAWLDVTFPRFTIVSTGQRSGFGGAIRSAWQYIRDHDHSPFVFHLEDDFLFERPVDLDAMAYVLQHRHYLAQMALRRQPWNDTERAAGGIIEADPDAFAEVDAGLDTWLEHRKFFTTNPHLLRRDVIIHTCWPEGEQSEGHYGLNLLEHGYANVRAGEVRFGYWGMRASGVAVTHIGNVRVGTGY